MQVFKAAALGLYVCFIFIIPLAMMFASDGGSGLDEGKTEEEKEEEERVERQKTVWFVVIMVLIFGVTFFVNLK